MPARSHSGYPARQTAGLILFFSILSGNIFAGEARPVGIDQRVLWTTSRISGSPEAPLPYVAERAFPKLTFTNCVEINSVPGIDRLFVVEQAGKIFSFANRPDVEKADLVADLGKDIEGVEQTYSIAFHPEFEHNRYCYVCYIKPSGLDDGTRVARFTLTDTDPPVIDVASETTIITWLSGGHNGCTLKFGPDGYLYISTGDGTGPNPPDTKRTGQDVSDLLSSILRIDVDTPDGDRNYSIPADNPFVDLPNARGEIWAYGLRNPWRMSFDEKTGDLWVGDVGWELWEMLNRIERGGNYGWAVTEGPASTNPEWPRGPTPILQPTIAHPHSESSSITDGLTYYGNDLKELQGTHVYADYDTGRFWGFEFRNGEVVNHRSLADTIHRVVGFGTDIHGEMYFLDHPAGTVHRLIRNPQADAAVTFPLRLSDTGLFESVEELRPAPGVIPYSINAEPWADHAIAERLVAVPNDGSISVADPAWTFPENSVLVKTLSLDMRHGDPSSRRRIETQMLHFDGRDWNAYSWQWNDEQTDAILVGDAGLEREFDVADPHAPEGMRRQTWRFSGRAECQRCHNRWSGPPLGFIAPQLHRDHPYAARTASQLDTFAHIGLIADPLPEESRRTLVDPHDETASLDDRARSYLHANCCHCHRTHAGGAVLSHMPFDLKLDQTNMIDARPSQGTFGIHSAKVISPGQPWQSVLYYRTAKLGSGRMPRLGSSEIDEAGVALIHDWIRAMPEQESGDDDSADEIALASARQHTNDLRELDAVASEEEQSAILNRMLASTSRALLLLRSIERNEVSQTAAATVIRLAVRHESSSVRDLFERFLPARERIKRLGNTVQPEQILSLPGNPEQGRQLFLQAEGIACRNCHRIGDHGKNIGPDLTIIGQKQTPEQLLESILEPSKKIDPKFVTWLAETTAGTVVSGLLAEKTDTEVALRDAQDEVHRLRTDEMEELVPQEKSLMPELLVRDMTAQQVADLVAFLSSLRETQE